jgi:hypothetical protein
MQVPDASPFLGRFGSTWMPRLSASSNGATPAASLAVMIFGLALGAELVILAYLTSRYFGVASFGMLFGTIGAFIGLAGSTGPVLLNAVYDATQSYELASMGIIPVCLISASLFLLLGPYPEEKESRA